MNYWLTLRRGKSGEWRSEDVWVSLPFTWLWELPFVCWQLYKAWRRQEQLMKASR